MVHADQIRSARIVARLRRVGMPVAVIRRVLADPAAAPALLDAHLVRLEQGLADARRELAAARTLLTEEMPMDPSADAAATLLTATAAALATALRAVRFAAGPTLRSRRSRACCSTSASTTSRSPPPTGTGSPSPVGGARIEGPAVSALLPAGWVDQLVDRLDAVPACGEAELTVTAGEVAVRMPGGELTCERLDVDYPDYRRLVLDLTPGVPVQPGWLREELASTHAPVALLARQGDGVVALHEPVAARMRSSPSTASTSWTPSMPAPAARSRWRSTVRWTRSSSAPTPG